MPPRRSEDVSKIGLEGDFDRNGRLEPLQAPILDRFRMDFQRFWKVLASVLKGVEVDVECSTGSPRTP